MPILRLPHRVILSVAALVACSSLPALATDFAYFGGGDPAGGNAIVYRYDFATKTVSPVQDGLDAVDSLDADATHVYAGLRVPGQTSPALVKRYGHDHVEPGNLNFDDLQLVEGPIESIVVSDDRVFISSAGDGGGLVKTYPKVAPFIGDPDGPGPLDPFDRDLEVGRGAGIQLALSSDGDTLYTSMQNVVTPVGHGIIKRYDVSDVFAFPNAANPGTDIDFGLSHNGAGTINFVVDEAADGGNGRWIIGAQNLADLNPAAPGNGSLGKHFELTGGSLPGGVDLEIFGTPGNWPTLVTSSGTEAFIADSINGGLIKQFSIVNPGPTPELGSSDGDIEQNLGIVGGLQYANGKLYALITGAPGTDGALKSYDVDGPNPPGAGNPLNAATLGNPGIGNPEFLELVGDLLFIGTSDISTGDGTLRIYDTVAEQFVTDLNGVPAQDSISGLGTFSGAFAGYIEVTLSPGDFDMDGDVDGDDFLEWQRTDGTPAGLTAWQTDYGTGTLAGAISAVPEPSSFMLTGFAATALLLRRRNRL